uniref:zinc dependent phospholipase C family protein n=1 Tax=uncultured Draconibacterium sp. TaxID=1573823 RepID=UPI0032168672
MASGLTHILLTKKLQDKFSDGDLKDILAMCADAFQVGAVAPDLPYASIVDNNFFLSNESLLADNFHYRQTNQIPLLALKKLKSLNGKIDVEVHYHMFSFFLGYISHVIADGVIHPFVRDMVGEYEEHQAEHRSLEMQLDVLFMEELTKDTGFTSELNYSNLHDELLNFKEVPGSSIIIELFSELISEVYYEDYPVKKILGWIDGLHRMFEVAEGDHPRFYRVLKSNSFTYRNRADIIREKAVVLNKPVDRKVNFLKVDEVNFFEDCVPQYYLKFTEIAKQAYEYVFENEKELDEKDIPLINLDTGRLAENNNLDVIPEFWK